MNKEILKKEIANRLESLTKEETVDLVYFLVVTYSVFISMVKSLGSSLDVHTEAFSKTADEVSDIANSFLKGVNEAVSAEKE